MSRFSRAALVLLAWVPAYAGMTIAGPYPGIGRAATPAEIAAWDIDVRPDFKGLPPGSGSVAKGQEVWEAKCASCHGTFGESNEVFQPIIGGTTAADIQAGRVKSLVTGGEARTTLMKLSTISTLWDYIHRAMPWTAPKSLTTEEVYAVVAYILNLGDIVPADFVLSDKNIAEVQQRLPNRNGVTRNHGLWDLKGAPDVKNTACMSNCASDVKTASALPDYAKGAHGDLAAQQRAIGTPRSAEAPKKPAASSPVAELAKARACTACHGVNNRIVGPGFNEVAAKYQGQSDAESRLVAKIRQGGSGAWGSVPMPANPDLAESEARSLVQWILAGSK